MWFRHRFHGIALEFAVNCGLRSLLFCLGDQRRDEDLITALWERGTAGIIEEPDGIRAFFDESHDITAIKNEWFSELLEERDESSNWIPAPLVKEWDGICVGRRFFFAPPWMETDAPGDRIRISLDSGAAFGTGRHETTQMMIERLESIIRGGETVIDVGCGSGVLSEVCRQLGAGTVIGCDIDPLAIGTAVTNFRTPVFTGSVDSISSECADILLVNISAKVIDVLAAELQRVSRCGSVVLLAGFVTQRPPACFRPQHVVERNEWLCWTGSREDFLPVEPASTLIHSKNWW